MRPLSGALEQRPRVYKEIKFRPITDSGMAFFKTWIESEDWNEVYACTNSNTKAEKLQNTLFHNFVRCFPEKSFKCSDDDQPWVSRKIKRLHRLRKRELN